MQGFRVDAKSLSGIPIFNGSWSKNSNRANPQQFDWRTKGAVTPVKNQGKCGSCWCYSTVAAIEGKERSGDLLEIYFSNSFPGAWFVKNKQLQSLSEQQLLDCASKAPYNNKGCDGGIPNRAFQYVIDKGGVALESNYPYKGSVNACNENVAKAAQIIKYGQVRSNENDIESALMTYGPLAAALYVGKDLMNYKNG